MKGKDLQIGLAGEYIACADMLINGLIAYPTDQGLPYDLIIDNGKRLLKCQVKTTSKPRKIPQRSSDTYAYIFNIKRHGKNNHVRYTNNDVDVFALVELENRTVIYLKNDDMPDTINIRVDKYKGTYYDEVGIRDCEKARELYKTIKSKSEIARMMNKHISQIGRYLQENYVPFKTKARYWNDYKRSKEWFYNL